MKKGNILIPTVVAISILAALIPSVAAVEENETITDSTGDVIDHLGEVVETAFNSELAAGNYTYNFDASNLSTGIYFYTISTNNFVQTRKMMLVK